MLHKLLAVAALLGVPVLLAAQAKSPNAPVKPAAPHGIATQVQGEVVSPVQEVDGHNNQQGANEANGQNHDGQHEGDEVEQEGRDEPGGMDEPGGPNDAGDQTGQHGGQSGNQDDQGAPAPPPAAGQNHQIGRHKP